jgi:hypothetical protein
MSCVFENKCFTFVAVERDLPLTRQFIPKVFVTTTGITPCRSIFDPFWFMNDRGVFEKISDNRSILITRFLPESFIFKFQIQNEYDYDYDAFAWLDDIYYAWLDEKEEEERIKKVNEILPIYPTRDDDDSEIVVPKRALH